MTTLSYLKDQYGPDYAFELRTGLDLKELTVAAYKKDIPRSSFSHITYETLLSGKFIFGSLSRKRSQDGKWKGLIKFTYSDHAQEQQMKVFAEEEVSIIILQGSLRACHILDVVAYFDIDLRQPPSPERLAKDAAQEEAQGMMGSSSKWITQYFDPVNFIALQEDPEGEGIMVRLPKKTRTKVYICHTRAPPPTLTTEVYDHLFDETVIVLPTKRY